MVLGPLRRMFSSPKPASAVPRVFTVPDGVRVYAVGDIHGRSALLKKMLEAIAQDAAEHPTNSIVEIFLGDYVDRGMQSREVIDLLLAAPPKGHERMCLMGNHEDTLLRFLQSPPILREWANFGGYATLASYGIAIPESASPETLSILRDRFQRSLPAAHDMFLRNLPLTHIVGDYLFVHAGILPKLPLAEQKREHLLWIRDPFLRHKEPFDYYVVHGHTPVEAPDIHSHRANLDISAAAVNSLCCMVIEGSDRRSFIVTD